MPNLFDRNWFSQEIESLDQRIQKYPEDIFLDFMKGGLLLNAQRDLEAIFSYEKFASRVRGLSNSDPQRRRYQVYLGVVDKILEELAETADDQAREIWVDYLRLLETSYGVSKNAIRVALKMPDKELASSSVPDSDTDSD